MIPFVDRSLRHLSHPSTRNRQATAMSLTRKETNMKQLRKWAALLLAFVMVMTLVPIHSKADFVQPTGTMIIKGVEEGATVKAYRLTKAKFDANGTFQGYENIKAGTFADTTKPTNEEWLALIKKPVGELGAAVDLTWNAADKSYRKEGNEAGLYMILVTSKQGIVYNPMLVGLAVTEDAAGKSVKDGEINVPSAFKLPPKGDIEVELYAKKSEVPLTKTTQDPTDETQSNPKSDHGNGLALNEKPSFTITTQIPSYPTTDKELTFKITDTLDPGLTPPEKTSDINLTVDGNALEDGDAKIEINGQVITITFSDAYLKGLNGKSAQVVVKYSATLNDQATVNFAANKNNVEVEYTNDPKNGGTSKKKDTTYHYTFDIDGLINGTGSEKTHEITKHGDLIKDGDSWEKDPLPGAEFALYNADPTGKTIVKNKEVKDLQANEVLEMQTVTTDATGRMNFKKLDEGVYYIKETKAPTGYSLNQTVYKVEITAQYNTDGTLKSYSIEINGKKSTFEATYTTTKVVEKVDTTQDEATLIKNTPLSELPSTGGMGTYLFTGIGVALLAGAAVMVTVLRKKNAQDAR